LRGYEVEVNGVTLVDWVDALIAGETTRRRPLQRLQSAVIAGNIGVNVEAGSDAASPRARFRLSAGAGASVRGAPARDDMEASAGARSAPSADDRLRRRAVAGAPL
jgi:hypothetical protein